MSVHVRKPSGSMVGMFTRRRFDRLLTRACQLTCTVDEQIRTQDWLDALLEHWLAETRRSAGWGHKPVACDFTALCLCPAGLCVPLPVSALRVPGVSTVGSGSSGTRHSGRRTHGYTSVSVSVPRRALMQAIVEAMFASERGCPTHRSKRLYTAPSPNPSDGFCRVRPRCR